MQRGLRYIAVSFYTLPKITYLVYATVLVYTGQVIFHKVLEQHDHIYLVTLSKMLYWITGTSISSPPSDTSPRQSLTASRYSRVLCPSSDTLSKLLTFTWQVIILFFHEKTNSATMGCQFCVFCFWIDDFIIFVAFRHHLQTFV